MASSGNFATLLGALQYQVGVNTTYSLGNTKYQSSTSGEYSQQASTLAPSSGKWYAEMYVNTVGNLHWIALVGDVGVSDTTNKDAYANRTTNGGMGYGNTGTARFNGSDTSSGYSSYTNGDIIQIAFDIDNTKVWFGKNNTWQNSGDPANGTNASYTTWTTTYSGLPTNWHVGSNIGNTGATTFNFGQDSTFGGVISAGGNADANGFGDFKYAPPSGFLALCSANLPISDDIDPAQTDDDYPAKNFNPILYTGNSTTGQSLTGLGFKPDLIWAKMRNSSQNNQLYDSSRMNTRGTPTPFGLRSDTTGAEFDDQSTGNNNPIISSFDTDGFTLGGSGSGPNDSGRTYVAWCWRANGGTTASNSDGDITSTVQANTKAGFSIVTYTGDNTDHRSVGYGSANIGHGLDKAPEFIITKRRDSTGSWYTYHIGAGIGYLLLQTNGAFQSGSVPFGPNAPTTTTFGAYSANNSSSATYVNYCWHSVEGFSKFGSYKGNGDADGPFIYTGFRPRMFFIKNVGSTSNWHVYDTKRSTFNVMNDTLNWNDSAAEQTDYAYQGFDVLSNGIKTRGNNGLANSDGVTYIYGAWGDVPFKYNNTF